MDNSIPAVASQLESYFGTSDLLAIINIKNKEAYLNAPNDPFTARQAYLRTVLRCHPESSGLSTKNPDQFQEYVEKTNKLFILRDIYDFLCSENEDIIEARRKYFEHGEYPKLVSLEIINEPAKCRKRFGVPDFEGVASELKEIYQVQMRKIKEIQEQAEMQTGN